jgi:hypothetical protein
VDGQGGPGPARRRRARGLVPHGREAFAPAHRRVPGHHPRPMGRAGASGRRVPGQGGGLFYVGDVKQAIYGWRGGQAALFDRAAAESAWTVWPGSATRPCPATGAAPGRWWNSTIASRAPG